MWQFPVPLVKGRLVQRYKRFLADVSLADGTVVTAHCPNTGSMKSCWREGDAVYLSHDPKPTKKLAYTWELVETEGGYIGVNTVRPNQVTEWALKEGKVPEVSGYDVFRREVKYGKENSRIDLLLEGGHGLCYVEVKNTTLLDGARVTFPDSVSERAQKHLRELEEMTKTGARAVIFFFVNRPEGETFSPADDIDPEYGRELRRVVKRGVEALAYRVRSSPEGFDLGARIPIVL